MLRLLWILLVLCLPLTLLAQPPEELWTTYFDSPQTCMIYDIRETSQGFVGCGGFLVHDYQPPDLLLFTLDPAGNMLWWHAWPRLGSGKRVFEMDDGGFLIAGAICTDSTWAWWQRKDVYGLVRTNADGDSLWTRTYDENGCRDELSEALLTADGSYFLTGTREHVDYPYFRGLFCMLLDSNFDTLWTHAYDVDNAFWPFSAAGSFDFAVVSVSYPSMFPTAMGIAFDGDSMWTQTYPWPSRGEDSNVLIRRQGDGYTLCGSSVRDSIYEIYLADLDYSGDTLSVQWSPATSDSTATFAPLDIEFLPNNGSVVLGIATRGVNPNWFYSSALVRVSAESETLWTISVSTHAIGIALPARVISTVDQGYLFTRLLYLQQWNRWTTSIVRLGPDPTLTADEDFIPHPASLVLSAFPNPFNAVTTISFTLPQSGNVEVSIFDVAGRRVKTLSENNLAPGEHHVEFDGADLPSGIYFAHVTSGATHVTQKLMLLK